MLFYFDAKWYDDQGIVQLLASKKNLVRTLTSTEWKCEECSQRYNSCREWILFMDENKGDFGGH